MPNRTLQYPLLRGWVVLLGLCAVQLLFLTLDWPLLGLLVSGFLVLVFGLMGDRSFLVGILLAGLGMLMIILHLALLETRMTPVSLLDPAANLVPTAGLHIHQETRQGVRLAGRRVTRFHVAAVVPVDWVPGQPVPYWTYRIGGRGPAAQPWSQPLAVAVLAPALDISEGRDLARELAAGWGSPVSGAPVMVLWVQDAAAAARQSRDNFVRVLLACLGAWPVLFGAALARLAFARR